MTRRIAVAGVSAVCLTALLVGLIAYGLVARDARAFENRVLRQAASHPAATLSATTGSTELAQLMSRRGVVLRRTAALAGLGQLPPLRPGFANLVLDGRHLRVFTVRFRRGRRLSVAVSDSPARAALARLGRDVLIAMLVGALLISLVLIWITRRALAPVRHTAAVADRIVSTGQLDERVPEPPSDDEIGRLARSMNRMLEHLESSDAALRRLVADASHELRSPITTLRGNLELLTGGGLDPADAREALADTRAEADRLGKMVEELLSLARADTVNPTGALDLAALVQAALTGSGARLALPTPPDAARTTLTGDPVALRALVRNLLENAERHGGGVPEVSLERAGEGLQLSVIDHGPGVAPEERAVIFDRFRRGRDAQTLPGSGLGLAIVDAVARAHGGRVEVVDTPGGGATFHVWLPRNQEGAGPAPTPREPLVETTEHGMG